MDSLLCPWAGAYMVRHSRGRKVRRNTGELVISPLSGLVLSAMLLGFQAIVQPHVRYRIAEEQQEDAPEDNSGNEPPGGRLFHQQLRKIRMGEDAGGLTVRADP